VTERARKIITAVGQCDHSDLKEYVLKPGKSVGGLKKSRGTHLPLEPLHNLELPGLYMFTTGGH